MKYKQNINLIIKNIITSLLIFQNNKPCLTKQLYLNNKFLEKNLNIQISNQFDEELE
jgi:hypothetical protein